MSINAKGLKINIDNCKDVDAITSHNPNEKIDASNADFTIKNSGKVNIIKTNEENQKPDSQKNIANTSIKIVGGMATLSVLIGLYATYKGISSETKISFEDFEISTSHVGLVFTVFGLITMIFVIKQIFSK